MKKILLVLVILINLGLVLQAQNLTIEDLNGNNIANTTVVAAGGVADAEIVEYMKVRNTSSANLSVVFKKNNISIVDGATSDFCVGAACYPPNSLLSNSFVVTGGMLQTDETSCHYRPHGYVGSSTILYTFYNSENQNDSVSVTIEFVVTTQIQEAAISAIKVFPNPATNLLKFDYQINNAKDSWFTIYNLLGNAVKSVRLEKTSASLDVYVGDLHGGIYFYTVSVDGKAVETSKLVINR